MGNADEPDEKSHDTSNENEAQARFKTCRTQALFQSKMDCLNAVPLFHGCGRAFIETLCEYVDTVFYNAGDIIFKHRDPGDSMYVLDRGDVEIILADGTVVAVLGSGCVFGEISALCEDIEFSKRSATVRAKTFIDCRVIRRAPLLRLMQIYPAEGKLLEAERQKRIATISAKGTALRDQWETKRWWQL